VLNQRAVQLRNRKLKEKSRSTSAEIEDEFVDDNQGVQEPAAGAEEEEEEEEVQEVQVENVYVPSQPVNPAVMREGLADFVLPAPQRHASIVTSRLRSTSSLTELSTASEIIKVERGSPPRQLLFVESSEPEDNEMEEEAARPGASVEGSPIAELPTPEPEAA
jgi:hypothetical protein